MQRRFIIFLLSLLLLLPNGPESTELREAEKMDQTELVVTEAAVSNHVKGTPGPGKTHIPVRPETIGPVSVYSLYTPHPVPLFLKHRRLLI